jgi:hypothetical protein
LSIDSLVNKIKKTHTHKPKIKVRPNNYVMSKKLNIYSIIVLYVVSCFDSRLVADLKKKYCNLYLFIVEKSFDALIWGVYKVGRWSITFILSFFIPSLFTLYLSFVYFCFQIYFNKGIFSKEKMFFLTNSNPYFTVFSCTFNSY